MFKSNSHMKGAPVGMKSITGILCYKHIIWLLCWASVALRKRSKLIRKAMKGPADFPTWTWLLRPLLYYSPEKPNQWLLANSVATALAFPLNTLLEAHLPFQQAKLMPVHFWSPPIPSSYSRMFSQRPLNMSMTLWINVWPGNCYLVLLLMHLFCPSVWAWVV